MEKLFVIFQSGKVGRKNFIALLVWQKKIIFHPGYLDIHFHNILFKIEIVLLISWWILQCLYG